MGNRVILKFEGIDYLDIRFLSNFLYWFKVYSTLFTKHEYLYALNETLNEIDEFIKQKNIINLQEFEQKFGCFLEKLQELHRKGSKSFLFWEKKPLIYIENVKKGSWEIYIGASVGASILITSVALAFKILKAKKLRHKLEIPLIVKIEVDINEEQNNK